MSAIPEINYETLAKEFASKNADLSFQIAQLEYIANALVKERDDAVTALQAHNTPDAGEEVLEGTVQA